MKSREEMETGNPSPLQCAVSLSVFEAVDWNLTNGREHQIEREKADAWEINLFFYCSSSNVDRPSEASDLQSLLEAPREISTLSCQSAPSQVPHQTRVFCSLPPRIAVRSWLAFCMIFEVKVFVKIWNQT